MKAADILRMRLERQAIARASFAKPEDAVAWFGAVQAQDYLGSLWALGLRTKKATEAIVEAAEARRAIVRTWPMRGTLHFVAAADARWITALLAPRVIARHAARWKREFGVDARQIARADDVVSGALAGSKRLSREQIYAALEARKIRTGGSRGLHLLLCLAMQARICLAGREGKQHTFALLDEWVPKSRALEGEPALAELALRYFTSHGPATLKDFTWWAGVTGKDARAAVAHANASLTQATVDGVEYWWRDDGKRLPPKSITSQARLLPAFDEYMVAYHDRSLLVDGLGAVAKMSLLSPAVVMDGKIIGSWKRTLEKSSVTVSTTLTKTLSRAERSSLEDAVRRYASFLGLEGRLTR